MKATLRGDKSKNVMVVVEENEKVETFMQKIAAKMEANYEMFRNLEHLTTVEVENKTTK